MSQLFTSGGQSIGVSTSASVLPVNIQDWFPLGWTAWISLQSRDSQEFSNTTAQKHQFFGAQLSLWSNSYIHTWPLEKIIALTIWSFVGKVMSVFFSMLFKFVIDFLWRSKGLLISSLQSLSTVILKPKKIKSVTTVKPISGLEKEKRKSWNILLSQKAKACSKMMVVSQNDSEASEWANNDNGW